MHVLLKAKAMRKTFFLFLVLITINGFSQGVDDPLPLPDSLAGRLREFRNADLSRAEALYATILFYERQERILDAQGYIRELALLANELRDNYYIALSNYYLGFCELRKYNYAAAINQLNVAYKRAEMLRLNDRTRLLLGKICLTKSSCFLALNMFPECVETIERGLEVVGGTDLKLRGRLLNNLGNVYADSGNPRAALKAYQDALKGEGQDWCHYNIATVYCDMECYDSAMIYVDSALLLSSSLDDSIRAKQLKGVIYNKQNNPMLAEQCFDECLRDLKYSQKNDMFLTVYLNSAHMAIRNNDYTKAMLFVNKAEEVANILQDENKTKDCLRLKAWILMRSGDYERSANCMFQYDSIREAMLLHQGRGQVNEIIRQQEVSALEQQFEVERRVAQQKMRYVGVIALMAILFVVTIVLFLVKEKRQKELLLKQELDLRNREVTSKTMSQMQTNEVLNEVIEKLTHLANNPKGTENPLPTAIRELKSRVDEGAKTDFDYYFVQVHPDFYAHLKNDFPTLSQNELRLCALIRANLNIKEIASLNNVSIDSVKSSRKRLRKSLGIVDSNMDLVDFLSKY